jgi:hypothetical protein
MGDMTKQQTFNLGVLVAHLAKQCTYVQVGMEEADFIKIKITKLNRSVRYDNVWTITVHELGEIHDPKVIADIALSNLRNKFNQPIR